jgi:thiamine-phosphate pyrophosphorylase
VIPRLHLITDDATLARPDFPASARETVEAWGRAVALHLRGPGLDGRKMFALASDLQAPCRAHDALLLVNDRLDVALCLGLPGAHLGQRSLPPRVARGLLGPQRTLGLSVHGKDQARMGGREWVDYLVVGTLFPTPSHPGIRAGGVERLAEVAEVDPPPLIGIGGITPERVTEVMGAGAHGVAVLSGVWGAPDPVQRVGVYLRELEPWDASGAGDHMGRSKGQGSGG